MGRTQKMPGWGIGKTEYVFLIARNRPAEKSILDWKKFSSALMKTQCATKALSFKKLNFK
jgi:hypothetical protein